jgi:adenosylcobinamide-GDP ribazoletransferase
MATLSHVSPATAKSGDVLAATLPQAISASVWLCAAAAGLVLVHVVDLHRVVALGAALALVTVVSARTYSRRLGGITGDFLGATEQLCELAGYAVLAWGVR